MPDAKVTVLIFFYDKFKKSGKLFCQIFGDQKSEFNSYFGNGL